MKSIRILFLIAILSSCTDVLDEYPMDFIGPANFYKNQTDALAAINGAYSALKTYYAEDSYLLMTELPTEAVGTYGQTLAGENAQLDEYLWNDGHPDILAFYTNAYRALNAASSVVDRVPGTEMSEELKNRIIGEAKFLRALTNFNLVRFFGDIPLKRNSSRSLDDAAKVDRDPAADVYEFIIEDLEDAVDILPLRSTLSGANIGRATREAALTLLAKVYLQRGSMNAANGVPESLRIAQANDFERSAQLLEAVMTGGYHKLLDDYSHLWGFGVSLEHENNEEVIFDIQNIAQNGFGAGLSDRVAPVNSPLTKSEGGTMQAELPFYNSFADDDVRKAITFCTSYVINGVTVVYDQNNIGGTGFRGPVPGFYKLLKPDLSAQDPNNFVVLRYADVLLMYAEALNEINNGPVEDAYDAINAVRNRAGLEDLPEGLTYAEFKDAVFTERRKELVLEAHGWFDSQRHFAWAKARVEASSGFGSSDFGPSTQITVEDPKFRLMPIPRAARDINPSLSQNSGY
jgi:hypothetical protein